MRQPGLGHDGVNTDAVEAVLAKQTASDLDDTLAVLGGLLLGNSHQPLLKTNFFSRFVYAADLQITRTTSQSTL